MVAREDCLCQERTFGNFCSRPGTDIAEVAEESREVQNHEADAALNLYDIMGPVAIGFGIGASYGATQSHGTAVWISLLIGGAAGIGSFLALRRFMLKTSDRKLAAFYVATPVCVSTTTIITAWAVRTII